ncbi:KH domain-containing protein HEN4-like isoform X1 [Coffea arabica]|uniref:KH domain-containing protein HEN4-like isoform X1 n=1 Tax=Coffea arabica TaxID=13443 RepID=A0ABM4WH11_COFAR
MQEANYNHHSATGTATGFLAVNGGGPSPKRLNKPQLPPLTVPPGHVCFRLLCHASRVGGIIGKAGSIIRQLQQETSAKIRVEDSLPNSDDHRVIVIIGRTSLVRRISFNANREGDSASGGCDCDDGDDEVFVSAAQEAVVRVFGRVIEVAAESCGNGFAASGGLVSCRLLAETSQVGAVIGKGGKVVEKIRKDTGCKIKVLTSEKLLTDEMVEIEGDIVAVKRALVAVTRRLQDCLLAVEKARMMASRPFEAIHQESLPDLRMDLPIHRVLVPQSTESSSSGYSSGDYPLSVEADRVPVMELKPPQQEVVFKILCLNDRVGGMIGKGGSIVRALQAETSASISVGPTIAECDERLITIAAMENPDSRQSPAQNAVVLVFSQCVEADSDKGLDSGLKGPPVCARLVVPSSQVGCLLGKGGAIVSEMRKATGAAIRIFAGEHVPRCALESDEVVQITGELVNVQDALYHVTGRLRYNLFATRMLNSAGNRSSSSCVTETGPLGRARDQPLPGFLPSVGISQSQHLTRSMENLALSQSVNRPPSPGLWTSQTVPGVDQRSQLDGRGLTSTKGGVELGSGDRSAIVTNTTVEIVVPENVIGSVYGDNGSNLVRLRQISGAKVVVHEPRPGTSDRMVVISGSPDETQAAQSLLHAFILTGSSGRDESFC